MELGESVGIGLAKIKENSPDCDNQDKNAYWLPNTGSSAILE